MQNISALGSISGVDTGPLAGKADQLIRQSASSIANKKIDKSAKDFESILLGSWLQQAEQSFASVPGGDDEDADSGKEQFQGIAMQQLGASMTAAGGIGISKMISASLHKAEDDRLAVQAKIHPAGSK
jgi:Rod binding domain-containing protein